MTVYAIYADDLSNLIWSNTIQTEDHKIFSPKLTTELNKAGSLEFTIPQIHHLYGKLKKLKTTILVFQDSELLWKGRILNTEKDYFNNEVVYCEGMLAFLNDTIIRPYKHNNSPTMLFQNFFKSHCEQVEDDRKVYFGDVLGISNDPIIRSSNEYPTMLSELFSKLINEYGGYLKPQYSVSNGAYQNRFHWVQSAYGTSNQIIRFGNNLLDINEFVDAENVFTVLVPLGATKQAINDYKESQGQPTDSFKDDESSVRLTIADVNGGKDYLEMSSEIINTFGRITRTQIWDDVTQASNLLTKARKVVSNGSSLAVTLSISAIDLHLLDVKTEGIKLGYYVEVISEPHGLDTFFLCSKIVLDMQNPQNTQFTLGVGFNALTDQQVSQQKRLNNTFSVASSAENKVGTVSVKVSGDTVTKTEFTAFQSQVNQNFTTVNNKLSSVFHYKGNKGSESELPTIGNAIADVWNVTDTGANYAWNGSEWDKLSENIDLSGYATKIDLEQYVKKGEGGSTEKEIVFNVTETAYVFSSGGSQLNLNVTETAYVLK